MSKPQADPTQPKLWRQGTVDTVGTVNLKYVLDKAQREQGTDEVLFLSLNCEVTTV